MEGPRDYDMITQVVTAITGEEHNYLKLQPEPNAMGEYGNGWKGVWKWCDMHKEHLEEYFYSITPNLDMLIIHMDGDVARKEKEIHCQCEQVECDIRSTIHPLDCPKIDKCPIYLPCLQHEDSPKGYATHLKAFLMNLSGQREDLPICFLTPCDSTDTWIVAALDDADDYEKIESPWEKVICHSAKYHGVRINRPHKNSRPYMELIQKVVPNWSIVRNRCPQAEEFTNDIIRILSIEKGQL